MTWNREVSRIVYEHCATCHRSGGESFPLISFEDAQPRATQIRDVVLTRRMPPWGAVKGFGQFENDMGLSQAQIDTINDWVQQGSRKGNNPNVLPSPFESPKRPADETPDSSIMVTDGFVLSTSLLVRGVRPGSETPQISGRIVAVLPLGGIVPIVWLYEYRNAFDHSFLFREPLDLPAGTTILGVPTDASLNLILAR